jgi:beta-lactamase superfamily II metal-dependent hydrolase
VPDDKPANDEIEVTLFGPGVGESIVVHCGLNDWMIVDSCRLGRARKPAALEYLDSIGVDSSARVQRVVATHWHDDHTKGLAEIVEHCVAAKFVCAWPLRETEFLTLLTLQNDDHLLSSDTSEFDRVFTHFLTTRTGAAETRILFASPNKRIWQRPPETGLPSEAFTLSPSDAASESWLQSMRALMVPNDQERCRIPPMEPNRISVALSVRVGCVSVLLSADLEEEGNELGGWRIVANSAERPQERASANKVAHHGSRNGDCDAVWTEMLISNPVALLTPYNKGRKKLPSQEDVQRILAHTDRAYITSGLETRSIRGKTGSLNRVIHEVAKRIRVLDAEDGFVRIRRSATDRQSDWKVVTGGKPRHLKDW